MSKALVDSYISHNEFILIFKKLIRNLKTSTLH